MAVHWNWNYECTVKLNCTELVFVNGGVSMTGFDGRPSFIKLVMTKVRESFDQRKSNLSPLQNAIHLLSSLLNLTKTRGLCTNNENLTNKDKLINININKCNLLCKLENFQPRLKICSRSIHVADDVTNVAYNRSKYKDSKKEHATSEDIFLDRWERKEICYVDTQHEVCV